MTKVSDSYPNNQQLSDEDLKQILAAKYAAGETKHMPNDGKFESSEQTKFHTEIVSLPSQGLLYDPENPLSSGTVEMKYMTAKEEDILTSQNLIKQGVVIDKLLQSLIVDKRIDYDSLLLGDKNAILIAGRILAYGKDYEVEVSCPKCGEKSNHIVDLSTFDDKPPKEGTYTPGKNQFSFELPATKRLVTFKCLTSGDEKAIENELKALKKMSKITGIDPEMTTRLKYIITSIDGNDDKQGIRKFVEELLSKDSLALRRYIQEVIPDVDMSFYFECPHCSHEEVSMAMPLTVSFFWPRA